MYLAFDTSGPIGSVAVGQGARVLASASLDVRQEHASRLVPKIHAALAEAGVAVGDLSGLVVGEGPGSFTGVRVAAATAKGIAHATGLSLWAFPSLAAAALAEEAGPVRYALFDARGDRVYGACYRVESTGVDVMVEPHAGTVTEAMRSSAADGAAFVGDGARRHRALLEGAGFAVCRGPSRSLAEALLQLRELCHGDAPVDATRWEPRYVRPSSADPAWTP